MWRWCGCPRRGWSSAGAQPARSTGATWWSSSSPPSTVSDGGHLAPQHDIRRQIECFKQAVAAQLLVRPRANSLLCPLLLRLQTTASYPATWSLIVINLLIPIIHCGASCRDIYG